MKSEIKQLIVIGDSSVYGWGDSEGGGWCGRLRRHWMDSSCNPILYPLGIRGDGLEKVAQRWHGEWYCRGELRRKLPTGLILAVGINDTAKVGRIDGRPQLSKEAFKFGLEELLKKIKKETFVMVMGLTAVSEDKMPFAECLWYSNTASIIYEAKIEEACLDADIPFLPLLKEMMNEPEWKNWIEPDGIHLDSNGHNWIYQKISNWPPLLKWAEFEKVTTATPLH